MNAKLSSSTISPPGEPRVAPRGNYSRAAGAGVLVSAALAMAATLPGRTHGLGLITTRLLADFPSIEATQFAQINLAATLIGSLFCFPCGWLLDRFGVRLVLGAVLLSLAGSVLAMSYAESAAALLATITLTRALGQSMLSVVSITMLGKWFRGNNGPAMGTYAVLMTLLMAVGTGVLAVRVASAGWRTAWLEMAAVLLLVAVIAWLLALPFRRRQKEDVNRLEVEETTDAAAPPSATLIDALGTSCFWVFALSISLFGFSSAGISLFQQLILAERGLPESVYHTVLIVGLLCGMVANLAGGWLATRFSLAPLLGVAMALLAGSLAALPLLQTVWQAWVQAIVGGVAGGLITVLFFAVWSHAFGPRNLGRIQAAAQMMTVLASATGPLAVASGQETWGSFAPVLYGLAGVAGLLALGAFFVPVPCAAQGSWQEPAAAGHPRVSPESS
ncbi:MFS transporter [Lignipirellula cremea]|uniref:Major Facilitator Superfamily protein n=1 Tax=Lignipirellula cremea TaxID=2528010 RepID=A0A518DLX4_9BACT|nr:MFS transporter [Lignipirellula cremea]QDU92822.1 Major Facilitator Superfamily protein [Lignipirellula cremea]